MKKGDLVKRSKLTENYIDQLEVGNSGVIIKGPYEKNITDILYQKNPNLFNFLPKFIEIKKVIDILAENRVHKFCLVEDYERVKNEKNNRV